MIIYEYEVELKLTNKNTKAVTLVTRREHAYSIQDAVMQAMMHVASEHDTGSSDFALVRIGPPMDAIRESANEARKLVDSLVAGLGSAVKKAVKA